MKQNIRSGCILVFVILCVSVFNWSASEQHGPDPWDSEDLAANFKIDDKNLPPDIRMTSKRDTFVGKNLGAGDWFFKRILAILLKGGQVNVNDDESMDVAVHMMFPKDRREAIEGLLQSNTAFTEEMYRRALGYVEEALYKPSIIEAIVYTWSETFYYYIEQYQMLLTWVLGSAAAWLTFLYLWNRMSTRHIVVILFIILYFYEAFVAYKEAEKQEYDKFMSAINKCKWYFWSSTCDLPPPDPLLFLKHMNPLKIGMRIVATVISEPMLAISGTVKEMVHGMTDSLWFPFDKIVYMGMMVTINIFLIMTLVLILFNFLLNIPFNFHFLYGLVSFGVQQRKRDIINSEPSATLTEQVPNDSDRISGPNLDKLLNFCAQAMKKSKSGKLKSIESSEASTSKSKNNMLYHTKSLFKRGKKSKNKIEIGSGDF